MVAKDERKCSITMSVMYLGIVCAMWLIFSTILLPLTLVLLFSKSFRSSYFAWIYVRLYEPRFRPHLEIPRKKAFAILKDNLPNKSGRLEVLEIGVSHGPNLEFYPDNCNLTVLDKNKGFESSFVQNVQKFPHISYQKYITQPAEDMKDVNESSFDIVVSTYLHCSADDSKAILEEVKRVLKPGGVYMFLDHIGYPQGSIGLYIQKLINPLWALLTNGCAFDRDIETVIKEAGFREVKFDMLALKNFSMYMGSHQIYGIAKTKRVLSSS